MSLANGRNGFGDFGDYAHRQIFRSKNMDVKLLLQVVRDQRTHWPRKAESSSRAVVNSASMAHWILIFQP